MTDLILAAITLLSLAVAAIALVSRHHLRIRHQLVKSKLIKVAQERDELRWQSLGKPVE
jgi:hypothetical protein